MRAQLKRVLLPIGVLLILLAASPAGGAPLRFFAVGDLPYSAAELDQLRELFTGAVTAGTPFLVHVGDIKAGGAPCTDANLRVVADLFRSQPVPVVYTPGDNEWTDCHREGAGGKDPRARLKRVREVFYADPGVLRLNRLGAVGGAGVDGPAYPENFTFVREGVLFVAVHAVGSNNGLDRSDPLAVAEFKARDGANARLLRRAAALALAREVRALVVLFHANPLFEQTPPTDGFAGLRSALGELTDSYPGPVLAIHGDTHRFKHDRPLVDPETGEPFARFVRVEVPGSPRVGGIWVDIDPLAEVPFRITEVYPVSRDRLAP